MFLFLGIVLPCLNSIVLDEMKEENGMVTISAHHTAYNEIEGKWLTEANAVYGTIHRIAVNKKLLLLPVLSFFPQ